jgi:DNA polymerase III delta prime subunit
MLNMFANLPRPVQAVVLLGSGAGVMSAVFALIPGPMQTLFQYIALGVLLVVLVLAFWRGIVWLSSKAKAKPFMQALSRSGGRAGDAAAKARLDDLRKKFEEGVETFRAAGKDLYSLPWYLLVGPPGSGKTEAMRHSNVGFPPGLQDCLQGAGGTLNMHWWFTNHAVVLDTAGRMFMSEEDPEWKQFLKMLRDARPRCPINGMLLVIPSESLLKDSTEKIEQTAGVIARQLDVIQRTLDVRFPVSVLVTKCDKIVGFREFFEGLTNPDVQHQILGWSNPAELDERFDPASVDRHLDTVRQRLMRRRLGLLQNPVHTEDPNARRTDQVDELFELPDNLMRIAPRLRRYLELIFVAGEWSPKPLFLRGIYFTSSMREGQALDVTLAQALGMDVEAIPGGKEWERDKSYFLRDVFLAKVFREKGLVTRAVNVSKTLQRQRALVVGTGMAATIILAGLMVVGWLGFRTSLGPPSMFWKQVRQAYIGEPSKGVDPVDMRVVIRDPDAKDRAMATVFRGQDRLDGADLFHEEADTPAAILAKTSQWARTKIDTPMIARPLGPFLGIGDGFLEPQQRAHRALVEATVIGPLLDEVRRRLRDEEQWNEAAVRSLAQLIRVQTYAHGAIPARENAGLVGAIREGVESAKGRAGRDRPAKMPAVDVDALFKYVLPPTIYTDRKSYAGVRDDLMKAVDAAYPDGFGESVPPSPVLKGKDPASVNTVSDATDRLTRHLLALGATGENDMGLLDRLQKGLKGFREAEEDLRRLSAVARAGAGESGTLRTPSEYAKFEQDALALLRTIEQRKNEIDQAIEALGEKADDPVALLKQAGDQLRQSTEQYFDWLIEQLPPGPESFVEGAAGEALARAAAAREDSTLRELRERLVTSRREVASRVAEELARREAEVKDLAPLVTRGKAEREEARAYEARWACYERAFKALVQAGGGLAPVEPSKVRTLTMDLASHENARAEAIESVRRWQAWEALQAGLRRLEERQRRDLEAQRDECGRVSERIISLARDKRDYDAVQRALAGWPTDWKGLESRVRALAEARLGGEDADAPIRRLAGPKIPLTDFDGKNEFDAGYHIDAAREVMGDFGQIHELVEPGTPGKRRVFGADQFAGDRSYREAKEVTREYTRWFLSYWREQAMERTKPSTKDWDQFGDRFRKEVARTEVERALKVMRDFAVEAYDAVPLPVRPATWERDKEEVSEAFAGLNDREYLQGGRESLADQIGNWRRLIDKKAGEATTELIKLWQEGEIRRRYFAAYRSHGRGLKYWNDVQAHALRLLIDATQRDLVEARNTLLVEARGFPLIVGPESSPSLSGEQVRKAAEAVRRMAGAAGTGAGASAPKDPELDEEVESLLRELSGANFVTRDDATRTWFTKLRAVADALGQSRPLWVQVTPSLNPPAPPRGGIGELAADRFRYARLYVGDTPVGEAFNLTMAIDPVKAERLRLPLPLDSGQTASIGLFREDPAPGGKADVRPDAEIPLVGAWHVLRAGLVEGNEGRTDDTGIWRVFVNGAGYYLWLDLRFEKDAKMPMLKDWPRWSDWPQR